MKVLSNVADIRSTVKAWKQQQLSIAFVPTMGNLHAGHLSLVKKAQTVADKVIVSVYVNPMQFGIGEDFETYPRTFDQDSKALQDMGADLLFLPSNETMYADTDSGKKATTQVYVPEITEILCGENRPGHFLGVSTVVNKLFNIVQPDAAIFGQKDFQQVVVIRRMVSDLFMPVEIITLDTTREPDGLAMSSRNQYLTVDEREKAPQIKRLMDVSVNDVINGANIAEIEKQAIETLSRLGFQPEYFSFRDPVTLEALEESQAEMVLVVAAKLGNTRLIDNCLFSLRNAT